MKFKIVFGAVVFITLVFLVGRATFVPTEWHDYTPLFPKKIDGRWRWLGLQRRQNFSGSSSETDINWVEWRRK